MKWKKFRVKSNRDTFVPGDWNTIDDRFGLKLKASATRKQWDGFRTRNAERRHEQDFIRSTNERIRTPWNRPETSDTFRNANLSVANGDFVKDSDWTQGASWDIDTDKQRAVYTAGSTDTLFQSIGAISTGVYDVTYTIVNYVGLGGVTPSIGTASGTQRTGNGTYTDRITSSGANPDRLTFTPAAGGTSFEIDEVRVLRMG